MNINSSDSFDCGHEECDEELKLLYLTRDEVLYIDDKLSMMIERDGKTESFTTVIPIIANAGLPAPVDLLDKIGMAVLEATDDHYDNELLPVAVTATDLYMLREITHSYVKIGEEPVGFNLKRKIYTLLWGTEYSRDKVAKKIIAQVDVPLAPLDEETNVKKTKDTK